MQRTMGIHECRCLWLARGKKWRSFSQAKSEGLHEEFGSDDKKKVESFQLKRDVILYQFKVMALAAAGNPGTSLLKAHGGCLCPCDLPRCLSFQKSLQV